MSTRWYPIYQKGNPQLRIYLPNFWMKLVESENYNQRKNVVQFHCSMEMTKHDIKSYLEKIYKVPIVKVNTRIALGKIRKNELGTVVKDEDVKIAYVFLPRYEAFVFPNMFENDRRKEEREKEEKEVEDSKKMFIEEMMRNNKKSPTLPQWFTI